MNIKRYTLVVKGTLEDALEAAHYNLAIDPEPAPRRPAEVYDTQLYAWMDVNNVAAWFASPAKAEPGVGYPTGSLLWYREHEEQEEWEGNPDADMWAAEDPRLIQTGPRDSEEVYSLLCAETYRFPIVAYADDLHRIDLHWLRTHPGEPFLWVLRDYGTFLIPAEEMTKPSTLAWLLQETREEFRRMFYVDPNGAQCVTRLFVGAGCDRWPSARLECGREESKLKKTVESIAD